MKNLRKKIGVVAIFCALVVLGALVLNGCGKDDPTASATLTLKSSNSAN